jgi:hypothetical protein
MKQLGLGIIVAIGLTLPAMLRKGTYIVVGGRGRYAGAKGRRDLGRGWCPALTQLKLR